jgi:DNA polymerase
MKNNLAEILEFYIENDLNEIISEQPQNRFLQDVVTKNIIPTAKKSISEGRAKYDHSTLLKQEPARFPEKFNSPQNPTKPVLSTDDALANLAKKSQQNMQNQKFLSLNEIVAEGKKLAQGAKNIAELRKVVENFELCNLKKMATNTVFADGNPDSEIMVIGEAPGNHEDLQGIPFCGDSGKLLDEMFKAIALDRDKLYITNVIFWRPPGNRRPTEEELVICRPFVERHIQLFNPKILILVGSTSMSAILGINDPVTGVRGKIIDFAPNFMQQKIKTFVIFHPSYLMRQPAKKKIAWQDLIEIRRFLEN